MATLNTQFEYELKKRIFEEVARLKENLAVGAAVTDFADYRYHTGQIAALMRVCVEYCDDANTAIATR